MNNIDFYCDGSARKNGCGAFALLQVRDDEIVDTYISNTYQNVTNSDMEVLGFAHVLFRISLLLETDNTCSNKDINIYCDNAYVVKGYNEWVESWVNHNWLNSKKETVAQCDTWKMIYSMKQRIQAFAAKNNCNINVCWVKGHSVDKYNNMVDVFAQKQSNKIEK